LRGIVALVAMQADPEILEYLQRIAWSQIAMAAMMGLAFLGVLGAALYAIRLIRSAQASIQPIMDRANRIAGTAEEASTAARKQVDEILATVQELNERLRAAGHSAELRVRDFTAVLDAVQGEAENVLLDTAATARGVHVTAERLRQPQAIRRKQQSAVPPSPPGAGELPMTGAQKELGG
jgi:hypothetical protein